MAVPRAAQLFTVIAGILLALSVNQLVAGGTTPGSGAVFWIGVLVTLVALGWAMADSFIYYRSSVRKLALGLTCVVALTLTFYPRPLTSAGSNPAPRASSPPADAETRPPSETPCFSAATCGLKTQPL